MSAMLHCLSSSYHSLLSLPRVYILVCGYVDIPGGGGLLRVDVILGSLP